MQGRAEALAHELNHRCRECLDGQVACMASTLAKNNQFVISKGDHRWEQHLERDWEQEMRETASSSHAEGVHSPRSR